MTANEAEKQGSASSRDTLATNAPTWLIGIVLQLLWLAPNPALAEGASLLIHPTVVIFEGRTRSANVQVVNRGDAPGVFKIQWTDLAMNDQGGLKAPEGEPPWSLQAYARYSPRRVTLQPGETQIVKIALRRKGDVPEGEYYSHLKVVTLNDNADQRDATRAQGVVVTTRTAMAIPIIWRNSQETAAATIESVKVDRPGRQLLVSVKRLGKLSTRGYLHTYLVNASGSRNPVTEPVPLVIYPSIDRRMVRIPLQDSAVLDKLRAENLELSYTPDVAGNEPSFGTLMRGG